MEDLEALAGASLVQLVIGIRQEGVEHARDDGSMSWVSWIGVDSISLYPAFAVTSNLERGYVGVPS